MFNRLRPMPGQAVAFYARVSTSKQKLEHQREMVDRWLDHEGIHVPPEMRFEDKEKRHKSEVRQGFQRLLDLAKAGKVDWIVVACFDRWGVATVDEFFAIRTILKEAGARLYSVQDQLDLTSAEEMSVMNIAMLAVAATTQMGFYGDRNVMKMVSMAQGGWHASKEHPYGCDLMCCTLAEKRPLFRVHQVSKDFERKGPRVYKVFHYDGEGKVTKEEILTKMPPRDCKQNGYRLVPSIDTERIETVKLIFELTDQGMMPREVGKHLHAMGRTYFGKHFGPHAVESIVTNSAYIGKPAWGKMAYGAYRQVFNMTSVRPKERMAKEPRHAVKPKEHHVFALEPVFSPDTFISESLWLRVQERLAKKTKREYTKRRASKTIHPLNGLIVCPDCGRRMVLNNSSSRKGERRNYFICGGYAKSGKIACKPNSITFVKINRAMAICWDQVNQKLKELGQIDFAKDDEQWIKEGHRRYKELATSLLGIAIDIGLLDEDDDVVFERYRMQSKERSERRESVQKRLVDIETKLIELAERIAETSSKTVRNALNAKAEQLEQERVQLERSSVSMVDRIRMIAAHSRALMQTLDDARKTREADVWDTFLDRVIPVFEVLPTTHRSAKRPTQRLCTTFRFVPKKSANDVLPHVLEVVLARKGRGSSP
jgi:predicted site-specific integrase-resolvase